MGNWLDYVIPPLNVTLTEAGAVEWLDGYAESWTSKNNLWDTNQCINDDLWIIPTI